MKIYNRCLVVCASILIGSAVGTVVNAEANVSADNSAVNQRDNSLTEVTAQDQSNAPADVEITKKIRRQLTQNDHLTTYAKNIKIIVQNGEVTLKGPVHSQAEKMKVIKIAKATAPNCVIHNQLEVTK